MSKRGNTAKKSGDAEDRYSGLKPREESLSTREKLSTVWHLSMYRPKLTATILLVSVVAALFEGIGLSFILPVITLSRAGSINSADANGLLGAFVNIYHAVGLPLTLEYVILGVLAAMSIRFTASYLVSWLQAILQAEYVNHLQSQTFLGTVDARMEYVDRQDSDEIINILVTQSRYAGRVISATIQLVERTLLSVVYVVIAIVMSPIITLLMISLLGGITYLVRSVLEPGYEIGDRLATANQNIQRIGQAGVLGLQDIKLYGGRERISQKFERFTHDLMRATVRFQRNKAALSSLYQLTSAIVIFILLYLGLAVFSLSLARLGVLLFAMFRLAPQINVLNERVYYIAGNLPHVVRTNSFIETLHQQSEPSKGTKEAPSSVENIKFEDVSFRYKDRANVLKDISINVNSGELVVFAGKSGAGKSTLVSILSRLYEPDSGRVLANGTPIDSFDLEAWRARISVVRQQSWIFNDTIRYNLTIGNRSADQAAIDQACRIARVTEFLSELPNGYDTVVGDNGIRLSGGQRQRIAIARALLKDTDLLVLDEATSNLDASLEESLYQGIRSADREYTILVIAHRLSTVIEADQIYTMKDGKIIEQGTHPELIAGDGPYARLYSIQATENGR